MATQKGRNWSSGDIVTAANLSSIERGVSAVAENYTPTTWANGNTVTAAALNNIEQGIANAGGGSSDFSTATVTVNDNSTQQFQFLVPLINDEFGYLGSYYNFNPDDSETLTVGLYKGKALTQFLTDGVVSVSGNAQLAEYQILITGDCTITIS